jgi:squalene cyclase
VTPPQVDTAPRSDRPPVDTAALDRLLDRAGAYVEAHEAEWTPERDVDFETLNHLVRVWIQEGSIAAHGRELAAIQAAQHADGGWGDRRDEPASRMRTSSFCCQMLLRAHRALGDESLKGSVARALDFILARQEPDGSWDDARWHRLDATSVSTGTLIFAVSEPYGTAAHRAALTRAMRYVLGAVADDGLWYHKPTASPVEITAHLLQKVALYDPGSDVVTRAMAGLLELQHADGHWDHRDVDSTCDAVRSLMLAAETRAGTALARDVTNAARAGVAWLEAIQGVDGGHGVRAGRPSKVLYTCDVIDTALKYRAYETRVGLATFYS